MRLWLDTEFNSFCGELISIALISEDDKEFYEVLELPSVVNPWVANNVVPHLNKNPVTRQELQDKLRKYLLQFESVEVIADWPEDISHFMNVQVSQFGHRIATPAQSIFLVTNLQPESQTPHNALSDAKALREAHLKILKKIS